MINPVAFEIGPFAIRWYALCIVAGKTGQTGRISTRRGSLYTRLTTLKL